MTLLHATCVTIDGAGVLLRGPSGAGKSDLALRLIDEGAALVADDYCEITAEGGTLTAASPANIAGKMEVRGIGVVAVAAVPRARVALVADLMPAADIARLPDATTCTIDGVTVPWVCIDAGAASAAARVRLAARLARGLAGFPA
jgi:serine kinase of HPr protein (carbohydrate metabolism regulator)